MKKCRPCKFLCISGLFLPLHCIGRYENFLYLFPPFPLPPSFNIFYGNISSSQTITYVGHYMDIVNILVIHRISSFMDVGWKGPFQLENYKVIFCFHGCSVELELFVGFSSPICWVARVSNEVDYEGTELEGFIVNWTYCISVEFLILFRLIATPFHQWLYLKNMFF